MCTEIDEKFKVKYSVPCSLQEMAVDGKVERKVETS